VWMAAEHESPERAAEEISQLLYHVQVLMLAKGLSLINTEEAKNRSAAPLSTSGRAWNAFTAERGNTGRLTSPRLTTNSPFGLEIASAPACTLSTSGPRVSSTRMGLDMRRWLRRCELAAHAIAELFGGCEPFTSVILGLGPRMTLVGVLAHRKAAGLRTNIEAAAEFGYAPPQQLDMSRTQ